MDKQTRDQYTATIGIECHVQLKTKTKLFSGADNDAREAAPNTLVNHIDFGLPGSLPVLNEAVIPLACRAAFALGTKPEKFSKFDRKHYFYPDLPTGYQITQFDEPIIQGGTLTVLVDGIAKDIGVTRAHLEADAGKSTHPHQVDYSLVDLNRAGTPLLEIVSEPDMHTAAEAKAYAQELYLRMKYAEVSEANLYYGNMRFDVNVSVSKNEALGTRTETKNLNSFKSVERTVEYEINRQIMELENGNQIVQETRGWDDTALKTFSQRTKEDAHDYRYFPDPDLPPVIITDDYIESIKATMPLLPDDYREVFKQLGMESAVVEDIIAMPEIAKQVERIYRNNGAAHAKRVAFWLLQPNSLENENQVDAVSEISDESFVLLSQMIADNKLSSTAAKEVLAEMKRVGGNPETIATDKNLIQESDESAILVIVDKVIADNEKAAEDVRKGETKAIGFLTGQVMKLSQGKANPGLAQKLLRDRLGL